MSLWFGMESLSLVLKAFDLLDRGKYHFLKESALRVKDQRTHVFIYLCCFSLFIIILSGDNDK